MFRITVQHNPSEHELQAMNNGQTFSFMSPNYSFVQALKQLFMNGVLLFFLFQMQQDLNLQKVQLLSH